MTESSSPSSGAVLAPVLVAIATAALAVVGTFVINGLLGARLVGKVIHNAWMFPLVYSLLYSAWFVIVATVAARWLEPRPTRWLGLSALLAFACFVFVLPAPWVNPELSLAGKASSYFTSYVASFMVLPAFLVVARWSPWSPD